MRDRESDDGEGTWRRNLVCGKAMGEVKDVSYKKDGVVWRCSKHKGTPTYRSAPCSCAYGCGREACRCTWLRGTGSLQALPRCDVVGSSRQGRAGRRSGDDSRDRRKRHGQTQVPQ